MYATVIRATQQSDCDDGNFDWLRAVFLLVYCHTNNSPLESGALPAGDLARQMAICWVEMENQAYLGDDLCPKRNMSCVGKTCAVCTHAT